MRRLGVVALVCAAGCSAVWDMDPYETESNVSSATPDSGVTNVDAATSTPTVQTSPGSSSEGTGAEEGTAPLDIGTADAALDAATLTPEAAAPDAASTTCTAQELEPNEDYPESTPVPKGRMCGAVKSLTDDDWFSIDATTVERITVERSAGVHLVVCYPGCGTAPDVPFISFDIPSGRRTWLYFSHDDSSGTYAIIRK